MSNTEIVADIADELEETARNRDQAGFLAALKKIPRYFHLLIDRPNLPMLRDAVIAITRKVKAHNLPTPLVELGSRILRNPRKCLYDHPETGPQPRTVYDDIADFVSLLPAFGTNSEEDNTSTPEQKPQASTEQVQSQEVAGKTMPESEKPVSKPEHDVEYTKPLQNKQWAEIFGYSPNKMRDLRNEGKVYHFKQVSARRWSLPIDELPAEYLEKYRQRMAVA